MGLTTALLHDIEKPAPPMMVVKPEVSINEFFSITHEDSHAELINGEFIQHMPATITHERLFQFLSSLMGIFVSVTEQGEILGSRFPVKLSQWDLFEPDILFIPSSMKRQIMEKYFIGCPPLIVEIISPTSKKYDLGEKLVKYFQSGMKEYWVLNPAEKTLRIYSSQTDYKQYTKGVVTSKVITGFWVKAEWFWKLPSKYKCLNTILKG